MPQLGDLNFDGSCGAERGCRPARSGGRLELPLEALPAVLGFNVGGVSSGLRVGQGHGDLHMSRVAGERLMATVSPWAERTTGQHGAA